MTDTLPTVNRQWVLAARPQGKLKPSDFGYREQPFDLGALGPGHVAVRNRVFLTGPVTRRFLDAPGPMNRFALPIGDPLGASIGGEVIASNHPDFTPGTLVEGAGKWEDISFVDPARVGLVPVPEGMTLRETVGGFSGNSLTAYFGIYDVGQPKAGETVVVSAAAGSVGMMACQFAKLAGCKVIGIAGGRDKCDWLTDELKCDGAIDYKSEDVAARLKELCPKGVDVYFDNVGGAITQAVIDNIAPFGRVAVCGQVSSYNGGVAPGPADMMKIVYWSVRIEGFRVASYADRYAEARQKIRQWFQEGTLISREDVRLGFDNLPSAFMSLFEGSNIGSMIVDTSDDPVR